MENTSATLEIIREMGKVNLFGKMAKNIKGIGRMVKNMVKEYGHLQMEICTMDNGSKVKSRVSEYINHQMVKILYYFRSTI